MTLDLDFTNVQRVVHAAPAGAIRLRQQSVSKNNAKLRSGKALASRSNWTNNFEREDNCWNFEHVAVPRNQFLVWIKRLRRLYSRAVVVLGRIGAQNPTQLLRTFDPLHSRCACSSPTSAQSSRVFASCSALA